ncbi:uncharacterized protein PV09_00715 [Verruconis gallopava]|uniref:Uncharacterized protein n=1 Tax=Verruconis gallopava TaxID=253628 RepID=A0A0D2BBN3_9PEZI|nr:uncharacterized protein PV09_00715 [Verruconis gallopava]KIW08779.1 hypothetical protein PV09_00715 [Verruconis gallopava]
MTGEWTIDIDHLRMPPGLRKRLEAIETRDHGARYVCTAAGRGHIYFIDPFPHEGENYVYHLQTQWKLTYPNQLKGKIKKQGFIVLDRPRGMGCEVWDPLFAVTEMGVKRGSIELNWSESHDTVLKYHTKPWVMNDFATLHLVLEETYPALEITMTVVGSFLLAGVVATAS